MFWFASEDSGINANSEDTHCNLQIFEEKIQLPLFSRQSTSLSSSLLSTRKLVSLGVFPFCATSTTGSFLFLCCDYENTECYNLCRVSG